MFEPTTRRIAATITEWQNGQGKAHGDNGIEYTLKSAQRKDRPVIEQPIGGRIEIYLDLDETGKVSQLSFNSAPNNAGGLFQLSGQKFYLQPEKIRLESVLLLMRLFVIYAPIAVFIWVFLYAEPISIWAALAFVCLLGLSFYHLKRNINHKDIAFILHPQGMVLGSSVIGINGEWFPQNLYSPDVHFGKTFHQHELNAALVMWDAVERVEQNRVWLFGKRHYLYLVATRKRVFIANNIHSFFPLLPFNTHVSICIRTDLLSDNDQIAVEQAIRHATEQHGKQFVAT